MDGRRRISGMSAALLVSVFCPTAAEAAPVTFEDVGPEVGIDYVHSPTARFDNNVSFYEESLLVPKGFGDVLAEANGHEHGQPGIALLDYDGDGDIDIYATNGVGAPNSLYSNQLRETGELGFIDVASAAGVELTDQDSAGVCFGDTDNDGDEDLFVVGDLDGHRFLENNGDGTFTDVTALSGDQFDDIIPGGASCVFGDIDNDGLLDVFVAHAFDYENLASCLTVPFAFEPPNELFINTGASTWQDISDTSGIRQLGALPPGAQGISWSGALIDYDYDGEAELFTADDQCGLPPAAFGGVDRGAIQVWDNDGSGAFSNTTVASGLAIPGQWMGLAFSDFNSDGYLDVFGTNMGDYAFLPVGVPYALNVSSSRWLFGGPGGTFTDPGVGDLVSSTFGWGALAEDFDNDTDTDIAYMGGISLQLVAANDTPGVVLVNDGQGNFAHEVGAFGFRGLERNPTALASADLDEDGRVDVVSLSSFSIPNFFPLVPVGADYGSTFDDTAFFVPLMSPVGPDQFVWNELLLTGGNLAVDLNRTESGHNSTNVTAMGTIGLTSGGTVNRDGIGAMLFFTPRHGPTAIRPVQGGSSHVSQNSRAKTFGLGSARRGTLEVLWPGGVRNRLYGVRRNRRVVMPEIPCSYDDTSISDGEYVHCVALSLGELIAGGHITPRQFRKLFFSAIVARFDG